jgi:hypothetical protein
MEQSGNLCNQPKLRQNQQDKSVQNHRRQNLEFDLHDATMYVRILKQNWEFSSANPISYLSEIGF